ncbi:MAG: 4Fe-4S binding protein [Dehalococcoidia bacterium]|nr:MAG: 4Fe-4S binding protein [Dehalococcoidia bacterium]
MMPQIDEEKCDGCGLCISVCLNHGLTIVNEVVARVEGVDCDWCAQCEIVCATGAICCPFEIVIER